jgi:site-specific DNA recombinase
LKRGKQIIIKGKDYVDLPENKFTVTVLGAVAEFERAKIIERTTRGRLHKLRRGELSSNGHRIYGYDFVRKSATSPAALVVNEQQAAIVRSISEMFASGEFLLVNIARCVGRDAGKCVGVRHADPGRSATAIGQTCRGHGMNAN